VLNRFDGNIFCYKYMRLYIACGNLMVNVDKWFNFQRQTQNKTDSVRVIVTLECGCETIFAVLYIF
jgi:hypothetical protein